MVLGRRLLAGLMLGITGLLWMPVLSLGNLHHELSARSESATSLRTLIAAETRRINSTAAGAERAQARLTALQARAEASQAKLAAVQQAIVAARGRLERLENRLHAAATALAANLVESYKDPAPDMVSVALEARGFTDLLERLDFIERIQQHNGQIVSDTETARAQVLRQAEHLQRLEIRNRALTTVVVQARNEAAAVHAALLTRQAAQLQQRATTSATLAHVRGQIAAIQHQIARLNRPPVVHANAALPVDVGGMAQAPPGAPAVVRQVIAAGNAIAGLPYLYGGGHGSFHANAYDCSGSVSYALAAAGLLSSPLDSTAFESWGDPGPGRWITVYANAGHAFMVVAGWRFDTGALSADGTRWSRSMRDTSGFVARHPKGV